MPAGNSPEALVARFLQVNGYTETFDAFISEAGLPADIGSVHRGDLTIEKVLEEKRTYDASVAFEKLALNDVTEVGWTEPYPHIPDTIDRISHKSNILHVALHQVQTKPESSRLDHFLLVTTAWRSLFMLSTTPSSLPLYLDLSAQNDAPALSSVVWANKYLFTTSMSGRLIMRDLQNGGTIISTRIDHKKFAIQVCLYEASASEIYLVTAGWDHKIHLYSISALRVESGSPDMLPEPTATFSLLTIPESMAFIPSSPPYLLVSRRESCTLQYLSVPSLAPMGTQSLAPHSSAWVPFTPASLALSPTDPTLLAVATSSEPHMKVLFVRLLLPHHHSAAAVPDRAREGERDGAALPPTRVSLAHAALVDADREAAAIRSQTSVPAPQTEFSTPRVVWRQDGHGVWVNGDDGVVRGVEAKSGKVVASLPAGGRGHEEAGCKIRDICTGLVGEDKEEWLVSGGFDRKAVLWRCKE